jgi:hypothetical protein
LIGVVLALAVVLAPPPLAAVVVAPLLAAVVVAPPAAAVVVAPAAAAVVVAPEPELLSDPHAAATSTVASASAPMGPRRMMRLTGSPFDLPFGRR